MAVPIAAGGTHAHIHVVSAVVGRFDLSFRCRFQRVSGRRAKKNRRDTDQTEMTELHEPIVSL